MMMLRPLALVLLLAASCSSEKKEAEGTEPEATAEDGGGGEELSTEEPGDAPDQAPDEAEESAETEEALDTADEGEDGAGDGESGGAGAEVAEEEEGEKENEKDSQPGPPKNLKVLPKGWSRKKVTAFMKDEVNRGLGVKCKFCHVKDNYASDKNEHKREARQMMRMQRAMNRKYFGGKPKVTCFTCHQGNEYP